VLLVKYTWGYR